MGFGSGASGARIVLAGEARSGVFTAIERALDPLQLASGPTIERACSASGPALDWAALAASEPRLAIAVLAGPLATSQAVASIWSADPQVLVVLCGAQSELPIDAPGLRALGADADPTEIATAVCLAWSQWRSEREAETLSEEVEARVRARTQELEESNLLLRREREQKEEMELEVRHASKLRAVGQLASGIAHEINTPVQFISDSVTFLSAAFDDMRRLIAALRDLALIDGSVPEDRRRDIVEMAENECDWSYLEQNVPKAINRTFDGLNRVATIVRAMRDFGHPDAREMCPADINDALKTTLAVARNEYKYVADIDLDLGDIPRVNCHIGDLNQVFLNLLVNAAHAIAEANKADGAKGVIEIRTQREGDDVLIHVKDSGCGVPEDVRDRVFEPFFTTKEVGRGTGQGLSLARSIVVDKHGGKLSFSTEVGKGTTFVVRLPVSGPVPAVERSSRIQALDTHTPVGEWPW